MRVLIAEPEAGLPDDVARALREAAAEARHEALPPLPPFHAGVPPSERDRFLRVVDQLMEADLLLADVTEESHGVAWCASWMLARGRLVVLTCRRGRRGALSPMLAGNPSPWQKLVLYEDADGLRASLAKSLAF